MPKNKWDCKTCYHWYSDGTCDMCAYGHPYTIDNNGLKPEEVKDCNAYVEENIYKKQGNKMQLNKNQQRDILIYAFRYALGRMSVAPHTMCEIIEENLSSLSLSDIALFIREIDDAEEHNMLGDARIDAPRWVNLRISLSGEIGRRESTS